ncbi:MAG: glycosyltransferase [Candidatus Omnitrophota bacterium]
MKQPITVVIIAKNEEKRIVPCLESVKWCDEIVVVDDMSVDETAHIARKYGAKVVAHLSSGDHDNQRNIGIDNASSNWILQMDADEMVSPELGRDIKGILLRHVEFAAFSIKRRNYFLRKFMAHGGWFENQVRLFRKDKARYIGHNVHETLKVDGNIGRLKSWLDHYAFSSVSQYITRQIYYATIESRVMYEDRGRINIKEIIYHLKVKPVKLFFKLYIKKQGFRDGMHGFIFSILNAWRHYAIWAVYWEKYYKNLALRFKENVAVKVDIIMPVASGVEITRNCIESIIVNTGIPFRLIVIDNKSDLAAKKYLNSVKSILKNNFTLIENIENIGWIKAVNQGVKASNAPYVCIMNNDVIVSDRWIDNMVEVVDKNPKIGLMNPRWEKGSFKGARCEYIETDWCRGFCVLIKREVIDKIGGFDEAYGFGYWEDHDYSVRVINAGYVPALALNSFAEHIKNVSVKNEMKKREWDELFARNRDTFEKKWGKPKRIIIAIDRKIACDRITLLEVMEKALELARKQNKIYIFSNVYNLNLPLHTNIKYVKCSPLLFGLDINIRIFFNRKRKNSKRYNELYVGKNRNEL